VAADSRLARLLVVVAAVYRLIPRLVVAVARPGPRAVVVVEHRILAATADRTDPQCTKEQLSALSFQRTAFGCSLWAGSFCFLAHDAGVQRFDCVVSALHLFVGVQACE
jgi:hypothetical protein